MRFRSSILIAAVFGCAFVGALPVHAGKRVETQDANHHVRIIARKCPGIWQTPACITALAESSLSFAANYAATLKHEDMKEIADILVQHCAASTAARETAVPAYAMISAMTECLNSSYDISTETNVQPDPSHYQLQVYSLQCLNGDSACPQVEAQLEQYK